MPPVPIGAIASYRDDEADANDDDAGPELLVRFTEIHQMRRPAQDGHENR